MMIEDQLGIEWVSFFRCSNADDECLDLMQQSGCIGVYLGIESGDPQVLKNMNKFANPEKYKTAIEGLHARGIMTLASFIIGYPGETATTVENTVEFLEESGSTFFNMQLYYHDPLAPIDRRRNEFGIQGSHYRWRHNTMCWEEAADWVEYAIRRVSTAVPLTLYGFSIWSIPYLLQRGLTVDQIQGFASVARRILIRGLEDTKEDYSVEEAEMRALLSTWQGRPPPMRRADSGNFKGIR
jgi:p-methyltransferase